MQGILGFTNAYQSILLNFPAESQRISLYDRMDGNIAGYRFNKDLPVVVDFGGDILSIHGDDQGGAFPGLHLCMVASTKKNGLLCHNALFRNNMANFSISAQYNR